MAYALIDTWTPNNKSREILDRAYEHIQSVPYKVSARWVFYRLLQDGLYNKKSDYATFTQLTSRARHADLWRPDLLADDTRQMVVHPSDGSLPDVDIEHLIERAKAEATAELVGLRDQLENYRYSYFYDIDPNYLHDYTVVIMFEARAMSQQFQQYTDGLTLCPFGGQASIPYKYQIAKYIERQHARYNKPIVVLYFGDHDEAGHKIFETGRDDIGKWCSVGVDWNYCGLTLEQAQRYHVPENIEKPGDYQWEALTDEQASEIITGAVSQYIDIEGARREARNREVEIRSKVSGAVNDWMEAK